MMSVTGGKGREGKGREGKGREGKGRVRRIPLTLRVLARILGALGSKMGGRGRGSGPNHGGKRRGRSDLRDWGGGGEGIFRRQGHVGIGGNPLKVDSHVGWVRALMADDDRAQSGIPPDVP